MLLATAMIATFIPGGFARPDDAGALTGITNVNVYDIDWPEMGAHPDIDASIPENVNYHLATADELATLEDSDKDSDQVTNAIRWLHIDGEGNAVPMTDEDTFIEGEIYRYEVRLFPNDGYEFAPKGRLTILLNGLGRMLNTEKTVIDTDKITLSSVDITVKKSITKVDISNIDMSVAGCTPDFSGTLLKGCHYHMATTADLEKEGITGDDDPDIAALDRGKRWFHFVGANEEDLEDYIIMEPNEKFVAGEKYVLQAFYAPNDGYEFACNGKCQVSINGDTSLTDPKFVGITKNLLAVGTKVQKADPMPATKSISVKLYGHDDIYASWSKVTGATKYKVEYYKSGSSKKYSKTVSGTYAKLADLTDGVKYYVKVTPCFTQRGKTYMGKSKVSSGIYTLKKLNTPTIYKYSSGKVKIKWNNIHGESGYQISRSTKKTGTYIVSTYSTTSGNYKVLKTTKNKNYYYKVRAYKIVNGKRICGPWSYVKYYKLR